AFGSFWVPDCSDNSVSRVDLKTKKVTASVPVAVSTTGSVMVANEDSVWILADARSTLIRVDPETNRPVADVTLPQGCDAIAFGESAIWVTCPISDKVLRIDPKTNLIDQRIEVAR